MRNPFQASSEKLPPSDPHDELVRTVDALLVNIQSNPNKHPTGKRNDEAQ